MFEVPGICRISAGSALWGESILLDIETSNHNTRALGFYRKSGFTILSEEPGIYWSGVDDYHSAVLAKVLQ